MAITLRTDSGSALTHTQVDANFTSMFYSASLSGSTLIFFRTGSTGLGILSTSSSFDLVTDSYWISSSNGINRTSQVNITGSLTNGVNVRATGAVSHAEGSGSIASQTGAHAEGYQTQATSIYSHAEGYLGITSGQYSHAEGYTTQAQGTGSHSEGTGTQAIGSYSHAEGNDSQSPGFASHAEGDTSQAIGFASHAEGSVCTAEGPVSHAEGESTQAKGFASHAEGVGTITEGDYSHAEGSDTWAIGSNSHAEGYQTTASAAYAHTEGYNTVASGSYQHVQGQFNISSSAQSAFIIGNGTSLANRSNLVFAAGSEFQVTGSLLVNNILGLALRSTTPSAPATGSIILSGSAGDMSLYCYTGNGTAAGWARVTMS